MDYAQFVKETERLYLAMLGRPASALPRLGARPSGSGPQGEPVVLIVAPHPDDECLMGSYAFRMKLEWGAKVQVFAYSLGSKKERQAERLQELRAACRVLDFELSEQTDLTAAVAELQPDFVFSPHADDGHPRHIEAHQAAQRGMNAFLEKHPSKTFHWIQTEFWQAMRSPNLLIPISSDHVAMMGMALAQHQGEVARNPYHLRLPAWYMDQVRRGSELTAGLGQGGHADWVFGQLYLRTEYSISRE